MSEQQQQASEVYQSVSETIRTVIMVAMEVSELVAMQRMEKARQAEMADSRQRAEIKDRLRAERQAARPAIRQVYSDRWWDKASPRDVADVYQLAAGWARSGDDYASAAVDHMRAEIKRRYKVEVPELAPHDDVLAALLGADPQPTPAQQKAQDAALEEPGESFDPATGEGYRYQIRDQAGEVVAAGELTLPTGANAQDAALAALDAYRRVPESEPGARMERYYDVAHDRAEPGQVPDGATVAVTPAGQDGAAPAFVLEAAQEQAVRDQRQAWRREILAGTRTASPQEALAAVVLEERAVREEFLIAQALARTAAESADLADAQAQASAAGDRLRDLAVRRAAAEESARGGIGELVLRSAMLRSELDQAWWQTVSPQEAGDLWRHVSEWPEGAGREEAQGLLRSGIGVRFGVDVPAGTDPDRAEELIRAGDERLREYYQREADAQRTRDQDEQAAARIELDQTVTAAQDGDPAVASASADVEAAEPIVAAAEAESVTPAAPEEPGTGELLARLAIAEDEHRRRQAEEQRNAARDQEAAARANLAQANGADRDGDSVVIAADAEAADLDAAAVEADLAAAAVLDGSEDVEAAEAVRTAAMVVQGTPEQRLTEGLEQQADGTGPGAGRDRELTPAQTTTGAEL